MTIEHFILVVVLASLALQVTMFVKLNGRIDTLSQNLNNRMDTLSRDLHGRIDAVNGRLDTLISKPV